MVWSSVPRPAHFERRDQVELTGWPFRIPFEAVGKARVERMIVIVDRFTLAGSAVHAGQALTAAPVFCVDPL